MRTETPAAYKAAELSMQKGRSITPAPAGARLDFQIKNEPSEGHGEERKLQARGCTICCGTDTRRERSMWTPQRTPTPTFMGRRPADSEARCESQGELRCTRRISHACCGETTHGYDPSQHDESLQAGDEPLPAGQDLGKCRAESLDHDGCSPNMKNREDVREQFIRIPRARRQGLGHRGALHHRAAAFSCSSKSQYAIRRTRPKNGKRRARCTQGCLGGRRATALECSSSAGMPRRTCGRRRVRLRIRPPARASAPSTTTAAPPAATSVGRCMLACRRRCSCHSGRKSGTTDRQKRRQARASTSGRGDNPETGAPRGPRRRRSWLRY